MTVQTNDQKTNSNLSDKSFSLESDLSNVNGKSGADYLNHLEHQLRDLWLQYVERLDTNGLDETAKAIKQKYFSLYQNYRHNKNWRRMVNN
ncbi:MAG: hypothetical protein ACK41T_10440 [Pseudobdellovibrio sp.]